MSTKDFKTKTGLAGARYKGLGHVIAIDEGYSSVKVIGPKGTKCFPSTAVKGLAENSMNFNSTDIFLKNEDGEWLVGELACKEAGIKGTNLSSEEMYGRDHYFTPEFKAYFEAALGLALGNGYLGQNTIIQTGLPSAYLDGDAGYIKEIFAGRHVFELKIAKGDWKKYDIRILSENIDVIPQPYGALNSVLFDNDGRIIPERADLLKKNVIVFDPGFGTADFYGIANGRYVPEWSNSFDDLGMREVLARTCADICEKSGKELSVVELQAHLDDGKIKVVDKRSMTSKFFDFSEILEKNCKDVCKEAIEKIKSSVSSFAELDAIIVTGGTYEAWKEYFGKAFKNLETIEIIPANVNDPKVSNVYSNVRGYYFYRVFRERRKK